MKALLAFVVILVLYWVDFTLREALPDHVLGPGK
jgi:hypothetical protein